MVEEDQDIKQEIETPETEGESTPDGSEEKAVKKAAVKARPRRYDRRGDEDSGLVEKVVDIRRVAKVVKGGKRFGFATLTVVGDENGSVGVGLGKANDVRSSIEKSLSKAKENLVTVSLTEDFTIPHSIKGKCGAAKVLLKPAGPGTGVIAGGPARAVLTAVGIKNVFAKCLRSRNSINVVYATIEGLQRLRKKAYIADIRGKSPEEL